MFESCCSPYESAHLLRARYGLPVELFADRPLITVGAAIEALTVPEPLARGLHARLAWLPATPAVADPRDRRRTFLLAPPMPYRPVPQRLRRFLHANGVTIPLPGSRIMLPVSDHPSEWHWVSEPESGALRLPPRAVVLAAARLSILQRADPIPA
ncbi:hypothetical protein JK358_28265 [Nocardia sp. 2]|uniref:Uncharacterized protein n=1 Tax=Nocardia acididurans TaxID=2802282 RepID=A0ABS1MGG3_9NOCA|nr:hypothetical protein [Nocardia acididurans]MBL1078308.1 hypothetical protein [Nocardia acididurans]